MKKIMVCLLLSAMFVSTGAMARQEQRDGTDTAPFRVGVMVGASTNGVGGFLTGQINDRLRVRVGYEALSLKLPQFDFTSGDYDYKVHAKMTTGGLSALVDYRLGGSFYVSAGLVNSKLNMTMKLTTETPVRFGDIVYSPEEVGEYQLEIKPKSALAPYFGIGFAPKLDKSGNWRLHMDLGTYYIGGYESVSSGTKLFSGNNDKSNEKFDQELSDIVYSKFYPVVRVGLSYSF